MSGHRAAPLVREFHQKICFPVGNPFACGVPHQLHPCCGHSHCIKARLPWKRLEFLLPQMHLLLGPGFFPCFAAVPDEFPTNGAGFWLWRNSAEGIPRVWLQALWDGGLSPSVLSAEAQCHGSALGMRRGTDGTPGNKSLPSVADVNSSSAP